MGTVKTTRTTRREPIPRLLVNDKGSLTIKRLLEEQMKMKALLQAYKDIIEKQNDSENFNVTVSLESKKPSHPPLIALENKKSSESPRIAKLQRELAKLKVQKKQKKIQNQSRVYRPQHHQITTEIANLQK